MYGNGVKTYIPKNTSIVANPFIPAGRSRGHISISAGYCVAEVGAERQKNAGCRTLIMTWEPIAMNMEDSE